MAKGKQATVDDAAALLRRAESVLILCHQKPDGDTLASPLPRVSDRKSVV